MNVSAEVVTIATPRRDKRLAMWTADLILRNQLLATSGNQAESIAPINQSFKRKRDDIVTLSPEKKQEILTTLAKLFSERKPQKSVRKSPARNPQEVSVQTNQQDECKVSRKDFVPLSQDKKAEASRTLSFFLMTRKIQNLPQNHSDSPLTKETNSTSTVDETSPASEHVVLQGTLSPSMPSPPRIQAPLGHQPSPGSGAAAVITKRSPSASPRNLREMSPFSPPRNVHRETNTPSPLRNLDIRAASSPINLEQEINPTSPPTSLHREILSFKVIEDGIVNESNLSSVTESKSSPETKEKEQGARSLLSRLASSKSPQRLASSKSPQRQIQKSHQGSPQRSNHSNHSPKHRPNLQSKPLKQPSSPRIHSNGFGILGLPTTLHVPELTKGAISSPEERKSPETPLRLSHDSHDTSSPPKALVEAVERQQEHAPSNQSSTRNQQEQRAITPPKVRVVRSYTQRGKNSTLPLEHGVVEASARASNPQKSEVYNVDDKEQDVKSSNSKQTLRRGLFGRSAAGQGPAAYTGKDKRNLLGHAVTQSSSDFERDAAVMKGAKNLTALKEEKEQKGSSRRKWLGTFRGKPVSGKPDKLSAASAQGENAIPPSSSVPNSRTEVNLNESLPHSVATSSDDATTARLVQSLTGNSQAVVTPATLQEALRELQALQSELSVFRYNRAPVSKNDPQELRRGQLEELRKLQLELDAARRTAGQLEKVNRNYRKTQKQMLLDLREAQVELENLRDSKNKGAFPVESRSLAEELAGTMAELLALREDHQALLAQKSLKGQPNEADMHSFGLHGRSRSDPSFHQHEIQVSLQKDLAKAMATIAQLERESEKLRGKLSNLESIEERLNQAEADRDNYATRLGQLEADKADDARREAEMMVLQQLQKEKRILAASENELREKLERLETKNKNQKAIFQTASEIKDVEIKLVQKERDMLKSRLEEMEQERLAQGLVPDSEKVQLLARLHQAEEEQRRSASQSVGATRQILHLALELDKGKAEISRLQKQLEDQQIESKTEFDQMVTVLNAEIASLAVQTSSKERTEGGLDQESKSRQELEDDVTALRKQVDELKVSLSSKDEQIRNLESNVPSVERRHVSRVSDASGSSGRIAELRNRVGNYETMIRSKVESMKNMTPARRVSSPDEETFVAVTPVRAENEESEKYHLIAKSLQESEARVKQLEEELADAQEKLRETNRKEEESKVITEVDDPGSHVDERVRDLVNSSRERDERMTILQKELEETKGANAQSSNHARPGSDSLAVSLEDSVDTNTNNAQVATETLSRLLEEKDKTISDLERQIQELQLRKNAAEEGRISLETLLKQSRSDYECLKAQMQLVSQRISESGPPAPKSSISGEEAERIRVLELQLKTASARLVEADSKIAMLEQFIKDDLNGQILFMVESPSDSLGDAVALREALEEKKKQLESLKSRLDMLEDQLRRSRSNVEGLELERARSHTKLSQLLSLLEKLGKDESDAQLIVKSVELAEVSAEKDELTQKLRLANAVMQHLESRLEEDTSGNKEGFADNATLGSKLVAAELKLDEMREKLVSSEKMARELEEKHERLSRSITGAAGAPEDFMTRMLFLEEQNAAYATALKALRLEIATRQDGTVFT